MNTRILLIVLLVTSRLFSQQTYVPDNAFEQFLIDEGYDTVLDDYVLTDNIKDITYLPLDNEGIQDLTGIADFVSLVDIKLNNNQLQTVDLSSNSQLQYLIVGNQELTTLNIANLTNLTNLNVEGSSLTSLDLTTNSNLEILGLQDNPELISLNTTGLTELHYVKITNLDKLETIDVSTNTSLDKFFMYYSYAITTLDLSNNTSITGVILYDLPNISEVSIKNGLNDYYLESLLNPNLTCIEVSDADYVNENWSRTKIDGTLRFDEYLEFKNDCNEEPVETTYISDTNFESYLESIGVGNGVVGDNKVSTTLISELTTLDVSYQSISDMDGLEFFTSLTTLNCSGNELSSLIVSELIHLTNLDCSYNDITALSIVNNGALTHLNCSANQISELNTLSNPLLEVLNCEVNNIEYLNLVNNENLTVLYCNDNDLQGLSLRNGNNTQISNENFSAFSNPNLTCVEVDSKNYSNMNWAQIDMQTNFNESCTPVNDDCSFTVPIVLGQDTPGSTISATGASSNPNCAESGVVVYDVWYSFIAPTSGSMNITIEAGSLVSKIALYDSCNDATPLNCDSGNLSVINLTAGQEYYLQVWLELTTSSRASESGGFVLTAQDSSVLSVDEIANDSELSLYPNPISNRFFIKNSSLIHALRIVDVNGKVHHNQTAINNSVVEVSLQHLPTGIYFVRIEDEFNNKIYKKIIKQ